MAFPAIIAIAARAGRTAYVANAGRGDYNDLTQGAFTSGTKATMQLANLQDLERQLKEIGPEVLRQFKKDAKKVGSKAVGAVRKGFREVGNYGPLGPPKPKGKRTGRTYDRMYSQNGRVSWNGSMKVAGRSGIDVNYKNRKEGKALADLKAAKDGTVSVVRIRVRTPGFIIADMAGKSKKAVSANGKQTRPYDINLFGRGRVTRTHRISSTNVSNWLQALDTKAKASKGKPSRYAYPAIDAHKDKFRKDTTVVLRAAVDKINRRLQS